jgi:sarcosine oxidase, subunit alpha
MRVEKHPILGPLPTTRRVRFTFDGRSIDALEGEPIAAALMAAGVRTLRRSRRLNQPRGIYCGIGHCFECRVKVDGQHGVRSCLTPVAAGMRVESEGGAPAFMDGGVTSHESEG